MISVEEATARVLEIARPLGTETVPIAEAVGRVLAADTRAARAQPPFDAAAMDGYALRAAELKPGAAFSVIGEAAAGRRFRGAVGPGQAVRIFTGAPVPESADAVVIQEGVSREGDRITILDSLGEGSNIRPFGSDFALGATFAAPRRLGPAELSLLAAMNLPRLGVFRRPEVALIATGDEIVMPGDAPGEDQIVGSNIFGLKAIIEAEGGRARILPVARDTEASLKAVFGLAEGADLVVTIGGASVGEHDLVARVARDLGVEMAFHKVAMRPGKPLMSGRFGRAAMLGLPGNPVSALVCGLLFLAPMLRAMQGLPDPLPKPRTSVLGADVEENGPRAHYMRARLEAGTITPFERQDSSLLSVLSEANALLIRPVADPPRQAGETVPYLPLG
ncbi:MAG: molybdopterin molybdotransferase MoeA [Paracoccaceae bacterium]|nr:molybdopterin molybdotransferase MoeA [Paracoccaceae bacterium]